MQEQRHLVRGVSMALSYVLTKGRASDSRHLAVARKWACISFAGDLYGWIPSQFNVADADSRRWENDDETHDSQIVRNSDLSLACAPCRLISDASPWMEYCAEQNPETTNWSCRSQRAKRSPIRRLVRWDKPTQRSKSFDPLGSRHQGDHLAPSSTSVPDDSDRSSGQEGPRPQFSRKQCSGATDDGQQSTGSVCNRDRAAVELDECCGGRGNLSGEPRPLIHPRLRAGGWESIASCYPHDVPAVQPPWRLGHAENSESIERLVETDAVIKPVATAVDDGGSCNGDSVATEKSQWSQPRSRSATWPNLRAEQLATLSVRILVKPIRPGTAGATGRFSLVIREEQSGISSKTRTFDDSVILDRPDLLWMDRLWSALVANRPQKCTLDSCESVRNGSVR